MRVITSILLALVLFSACVPGEKSSQSDTTSQAIDLAIVKLNKSVVDYNDLLKNPRCYEHGQTEFVPSRDWTSGFYPGCLWYAYELSNDSLMKQAAIRHTELIEAEKFNGGTHDMGFKMYCSYGNAYRLTGNPEYKEILLQSAKTLITRYNPTIGCIRSWDHNRDKWQFPVIIDNMMNLELLMWAFKETKDSVYYNIAVSHADVTMKNHFREDYSSYHVIDYDTITGEVTQKNTHQGYSHETPWARGQGWALYGYTMMFRETGDSAYLNQAEHVADFILTHENLPADMVPYWDFDHPEIPNTTRDASAAAVMSSALFELQAYSVDNSVKYKAAAQKMLESLSSDSYFAAPEAEHNFLLEHSTGDMSKNAEIDVPIIYGDYYFLEALIRSKK